MLISRELYKKYCEKEDSIPVFSQYWWLDATAGKDNWSVAAVINGSKLEASLPFFIKKEKFMTFICQPLLTQKLGPWFNREFTNNSEDIQRQNYLLEELLNSLPKHDVYNQGWDHLIFNWLPFYWQDFSQTTKYTYRIEDISKIDNIYKNFKRDKKQNLNKSKKLLNIYINLDKSTFYNNHQRNLKKLKKNINYSRDYFYKIYEAAVKHNSGFIISAHDNEGNIHSSNFIIWDKNSAYNLISSIDPHFKSSGSQSLLIFEAIKFLSNKTKSFDFEGSMIQNVENSFRRFGAKQISYFNISRNSSKKAKILFALNNLYKSIFS